MQKFLTAVKVKCHKQDSLVRIYSKRRANLVTVLEITAFFGAVELIKKLPSILNTSFEAAELGQALFSALRGGQGAALRLLIDMGADVGVKTPWGEGPLSVAAYHGDLDATRLFLDLGADPNEYDEWIQGPAVLAASEGHTAVVRLLLERGSRFDDQDDNDLGVVDYAVKSNNKTMIQDIFETTTEPNRHVYLKELMLKAAVTYKRMECIQLVLEKDPPLLLRGRFGSRLLSIALTHHEPSTDIVGLLLKKGARPMQKGDYGGEMILKKTKVDRQWLAAKIPSLFTGENTLTFHRHNTRTFHRINMLGKRKPYMKVYLGSRGSRRMKGCMGGQSK